MRRLTQSIDFDGRSHIKALLGPTNTGKTHRAIQRMLSHRTGMIGFPLRLLAREVYDKLCEWVGVDSVALVTGEERIIPSKARFYSCTVESMPLSLPVAFVAVDEIQLATHRERGHVFTDRLLHARGVKETWFLGSDTMSALLSRLVPTVEIITHPRLSQLSYTGIDKVRSLRPRSAVVAFSATHVYEIAERVRSARGGTAIVMGALSPRTRNAQVEMYQSGDVHYIVSTDAIGMGLNLDIHHLTLGATRKFDGRQLRDLEAAEIGQIAGRAGRFRRDGTFGLTNGCVQRSGALPPDVVTAVQSQVFQPVRRVYYRNSRLNFSSQKALLDSLARRPPHGFMRPVRDAVDHDVLRALLASREISARVGSEGRLRQLWEVCCIPDFRRHLGNEHSGLLSEIFTQLDDNGELNADWVQSRINRLDRTSGGIELLMSRIACIRTWTYVSHRQGWLTDGSGLQQRTRQIEDRLSDALHEQLTQRFVDQRATVLVHELSLGFDIEASLSEDGQLTAAGVVLGRLEGLDFVAEGTKSTAGLKAVDRAARQALVQALSNRVDALAEAPHLMFGVSEDLQLRWGQVPLAWLRPGESVLTPRFKLRRLEMLSTQQRKIIRRRVRQWCHDEAELIRSPLRNKTLHGPAAGLLYSLEMGLGCIKRVNVRDQIGQLSAKERKTLARMGIRLGYHTVYSSALLQSDAILKRCRLWAIQNRFSPLPELGGEPTVVAEHPEELYWASGYQKLAQRAVRVDVLERVDASLRKITRSGKESRLPKKLETWLECPHSDLVLICRGLGYRCRQRGEEWTISRARRSRRSSGRRGGSS